MQVVAVKYPLWWERRTRTALSVLLHSTWAFGELMRSTTALSLECLGEGATLNNCMNYKLYVEPKIPV